MQLTRRELNQDDVMSHQQGETVETVMISLNVTNMVWYTNQRDALFSESDVTGVVKTITMQDCHKTSKKINKIEYQSDYDDLEFDTINASGWDG